jgi:hypothetical protein
MSVPILARVSKMPPMNGEKHGHPAYTCDGWHSEHPFRVAPPRSRGIDTEKAETINAHDGRVGMLAMPMRISPAHIANSR